MTVILTLFVVVGLLILCKISYGENEKKKELEKFKKLICKFEQYVSDDETVRTHWPLSSVMELNNIDYGKIAKSVEKTGYKRVTRLAKDKSNCPRLAKKDPTRLEYIRRFQHSLERIEDRINL